jgi:hypothetical protein
LSAKKISLDAGRQGCYGLAEWHGGTLTIENDATPAIAAALQYLQKMTRGQ